MLSRLITGLTSGAGYALVAVGIVLIFRAMRILSLAQGEIGAFGFLLALRWAERGIPVLGWHLSPFMTLVVAVVVGALVGAVAELVIRPLATRPPIDALIATLGIALFLALLEREMFGTAAHFARSPAGQWDVEIFGATLTAPRVVAIIALAVVALIAWLFFTRTRFGLAVLATAGDPDVARVLGVPVVKVYRFVWIAAGALAGLAAALLSASFTTIAPFTMTRYGLRALAGAVIGGLDSIWGAIVGCLAVGVIESVVGGTFTEPGTADMAILALVVGTLLLRPRGLLGTATAG